jgi:hypothetical protein
MDLIERSSALEIVRRTSGDYAAAFSEIGKLPGVEATPVMQGQWENKPHTTTYENMTISGTYPTCSLCGFAEMGLAQQTKYCPGCGAKMGGEINYEDY